LDRTSTNHRFGDAKIQLHHDAIIESTRRWISAVVIGLNLCPFAGRVFHGNLIRFVVSDATDDENLRSDLASELTLLATAPPAGSSPPPIHKSSPPPGTNFSR